MHIIYFDMHIDEPKELLIFALTLVAATWMFSRMVQTRMSSGEWLRIAIGRIGGAIVTTDRRGRITWLNDVAEKLTGWSLKEAKGKPSAEVLRFVEHDTRAAIDDPVLLVLESGEPAKFEKKTTLVARGGAEYPVESSAAPIRQGGGRVRGVLLLFQDITPRYLAEQRLLESEQRLKAVTDEARIGLVMINRDRRYVYANQFYLQMVGLGEAIKVAGKRVEDVLPVLYRQIGPNLDRAFAGERLSYEIGGINKKEQGLNRIYSVTYEPQRHQSLVMHVIIVIVDITHIRRDGDNTQKASGIV